MDEIAGKHDRPQAPGDQLSSRSEGGGNQFWSGIRPRISLERYREHCDPKRREMTPGNDFTAFQIFATLALM
jgi:hypothetical protein